MDKTKFTRDPQLDSEGFVDPAAACRGCEPDEPCPRSGHCERYNSPLRFERILANIHRDGINWDRVNNPEQYAKLDAWAADERTLLAEWPPRKPGGKVATFSSLLHDWKKVVR